MVLERRVVHLGDYQRHLRVEPEVAAVVYYERTAAYRLVGELDGGALLALRSGEEGDVHALERPWLGDADLELLPGEDGPAGAAGQDAQLPHRELAALQLRHESVADQPRAYDCHRVSLAHISPSYRTPRPCALCRAGRRLPRSRCARGPRRGRVS
jgi:hypothetical protein